MSKKAMVFNIERFATEDGHGIRTVVFLKGCGLACDWCANPESQSFKEEVIFNERLCVGCGACLAACHYDAIEMNHPMGLVTNPDKCVGCGACVNACNYNARSLVGEKMSTGDLLDIILKDQAYYEKSRGGVTFSGGEPLLQSAFLKEMIPLLKKEGIHVLIETCGYVSRQQIEDIMSLTDGIFMDLKQMDPDKHQEYTGHDNQLILENMQYVNDHFKGEFVIRYPYIPTKNDHLDDIDRAVAFVESLDQVQEMVFLPYHRLGLPKYRGLGRTYKMGNRKSMKKKDLNFLLDRYKRSPLKIRIG